MSALAKTSEADIQIEGRVDAVANGRVYGWAWDRAAPEGRLEIQVRLPGPAGETVLGTGLADHPRPDLAANGVGDGRHAFEIALGQDAPAEPGDLLVVARDPASGRELALQSPSEPERILEQAVSPHLLRLAAIIDGSRAEQKRLAAAQQAVARAVADIQQQVPAKAELEARLDSVAADLAELRERVAGLDVYLLRMDQSLHGITAKLGAREGSDRRALGRVALAALGVGLAIGFVALVIARAGIG